MATQESVNTDKAFLECPVCYQECVHPVRLPCSHIFCYLCVKGAVTRTKCCAMCRRNIPMSYLENPEIVNNSDLDLNLPIHTEDVQWFYQARRRGWWLYEKRIADEIEEKYRDNPHDIFDLQIAGFLYTIDLENMEQYRKDDNTVRRAIKRDHIKYVAEVQGKAGLRIKNTSNNSSSSNRTVEGGPSADDVTAVAPSPASLTRGHRATSNTTGGETALPQVTRTVMPRSRAAHDTSFQMPPVPVDLSQLVADMNLLDREDNSSDDSNELQSCV